MRRPNPIRGRKRVGTVAGTKDVDGFTRISIDGRAYYAQDLVWLHEHGKFPDPGYEVFHLNGERSDNRLSNLSMRKKENDKA